ncbi:MAG: hypothetical protein QHC77_07400 [Stenotrophomonas sp.]|uniref:hypothetical protein n=1 Tax=unclassified Stenotrophomonas TaxID=196198 RepID=UPI0029BE218D|nr:hypothetical protein [Stenotrophomonas sp.]MDX3931748.1 hypothetical protein [Stenotrophomonas sp.]
MHVPDPHDSEAARPAPIRRAITLQASVERVLDAWTDPAVQSVLFAGFADFVESSREGSRWRVSAPLGQHPVVFLRTVGQSALRVQQDVEGDAGVLASLSLTARPCVNRDGVEAELQVRYAPDGVVERLAARLLDPAPPALAGQILRRLRAGLETGEVPTLQSNPAAR